MIVSRRNFLRGTGALIAAPAIVRIESLMRVRAAIVAATPAETAAVASGHALLTIQQITREAIRLWKNSPAFLLAIDQQYDDEFQTAHANVMEHLRIRLPAGHLVAA